MGICVPHSAYPVAIHFFIVIKILYAAFNEKYNTYLSIAYTLIMHFRQVVLFLVNIKNIPCKSSIVFVVCKLLKKRKVLIAFFIAYIYANLIVLPVQSA